METTHQKNLQDCSIRINICIFLSKKASVFKGFLSQETMINLKGTLQYCLLQQQQKQIFYQICFLSWALVRNIYDEVLKWKLYDYIHFFKIYSTVHCTVCHPYFLQFLSNAFCKSFIFIFWNCMCILEKETNILAL